MKYIDKDKRKNRKLKVLPTVIAIGIVVVFGAMAFVALGGVTLKKPSEQIPAEPLAPSSKPPSSQPPSSKPPSSEEVKDTAVVDYSSEEENLFPSSKPPKPASSSKPVSSAPVSSAPVSSAPVSSAPVPSQEVTSEPIIIEDNPPETTEPVDENENIDFKAPEVPLMEPPSGSPADWNLILLNHDKYNKIDSELGIEKTKFDSQYVDSRAADAYKAMSAAAKEKGITLFLRSGYRSIKTQNINYNANIQREIKRGHNKEDAIRLTKLYYTEPGHSEHHTGLAFDIITPQYHKDIYTLSEKFAQTDAYKFMSEHCTEYGFILRYPKDKQEITDINFEPWHYRYVGVEHAKFMLDNGLCLEEYIDLLNYLGR